MSNKVRVIGFAVIAFAVVSFAMGAVFIQQGFAKEAFLNQAMTEERITLAGVDGIIDNAGEAQVAGDTIRQHRRAIAPTYGDLLAGKRFDPTDPRQLTYAQALNLETYLYLAVAGYGVVTMAKAMGLFMIVTGLALGTAGYGLVRTGGA